MDRLTDARTAIEEGGKGDLAAATLAEDRGIEARQAAVYRLASSTPTTPKGVDLLIRLLEANEREGFDGPYHKELFAAARRGCRALVGQRS